VARRKARKKAGETQHNQGDNVEEMKTKEKADEDDENGRDDALPNLAFFGKRRVDLTTHWRNHKSKNLQGELDMWLVRYVPLESWGWRFVVWTSFGETTLWMNI